LKLKRRPPESKGLKTLRGESGKDSKSISISAKTLWDFRGKGKIKPLGQDSWKTEDSGAYKGETLQKAPNVLYTFSKF
jgi:hypothetical protein